MAPLTTIFQKNWTEAVQPEAFNQFAKIMLSKPGKTDYNTVSTVRAHVLITLESVLEN